MPAFQDITGQKFGLLTVEKYSYTKNKRVHWLCKCDCGTTKEVQTSYLKSGNTKSCGCYKLSQTSLIMTKHGSSKTAEYSAWQGMKGRCYRKKNKKYPIYGGRGITVCDQWLESFDAFYAAMGDRPSPKHSVDRIDTNGNYEPSNCRWATASQQAINRRIKNPSGCNGVLRKKDHRYPNKHYDTFTAHIRVKRKTISLGVFISIESAIEARKAAELKYWGNDGKD